MVTQNIRLKKYHLPIHFIHILYSCYCSKNCKNASLPVHQSTTSKKVLSVTGRLKQKI